MRSVQIELEKLGEALRRTPLADRRWAELYSAQQALYWATEQMAKSPFDLIESGFFAVSTDVDS